MLVVVAVIIGLAVFYGTEWWITTTVPYEGAPNGLWIRTALHYSISIFFAVTSALITAVRFNRFIDGLMSKNAMMNAGVRYLQTLPQGTYR